MSMLNGALDKVAGYLDKQLIIIVLFPSLVFWSALLALVSNHVGWSVVGEWWNGLRGEQQAILSVGVAAAAVFFASVLSVQIGALTRLYEGYWGRAGRWLAVVGTSVQRKRHARLHPDTDDRDYEFRYRNYPRHQDDLLPTRLGNILLAAELYPSEDGRYGIDAVFFWPRLYAVLPETMRNSLREARSSLDLMLITSWLSVLFTFVAAIFLAFTGTGTWRPWCLAVGGAGFVALTAYQGAIRAAVTYGELVRTAFDLYRNKLLIQLGYASPTSLVEEQKIWRNLGQQLYRRAASDPTALRYGNASDKQTEDHEHA